MRSLSKIRVIVDIDKGCVVKTAEHSSERMARGNLTKKEMFEPRLEERKGGSHEGSREHSKQWEQQVQIPKAWHRTGSIRAVLGRIISTESSRNSTPDRVSKIFTGRRLAWVVHRIWKWDAGQQPFQLGKLQGRARPSLPAGFLSLLLSGSWLCPLGALSLSTWNMTWWLAAAATFLQPWSQAVE